MSPLNYIYRLLKGFVERNEGDFPGRRRRLNCKKTANPRKLPYVVDRRLLARFKRLLDRTGAKVVLSST